MAEEKKKEEEQGLNYTPIAKPNVGAAPTATTHVYNPWSSTTQGKAAYDTMSGLAEQVYGYGQFDQNNWVHNDWYNQVMADIENRPDFTYDFNTDAMYQQYKDKYMKQGKMAMQDTMGQAAAMTGGYGSSYASTAGNQAYQASLENLNDIIPQLYQMAYDQYNQKTQDLYNQHGLLSSELATAKQDHMDGYNMLLNQYGIASDDYYNGGSIYDTEQKGIIDTNQANFENAFAIWDANAENAWKGAEWDEDNRRWEIDDDRAEREFEKKYSIVETGGSGGGSTGGSGGGTGSGTTGGSGGGTGDPKPASFTGKTYESAVKYMEQNGVPSSYASGVMTAGEWSRRRSSYQTTGQGNAAVKNYKTYQEYLNDFVTYALENYGKK